MLIFTALADPTRRRIVEMLANGELAATEIAGRFNITPSGISQHLKILRDARLINRRVVAQHRIYELDPAGIQELDDWLEKIKLAGRSQTGDQESDGGPPGRALQSDRPRRNRSSRGSTRGRSYLGELGNGASNDVATTWVL